MLGLKEGETLAVTGGAGLLASYVIPLAKEHGLRVIADAKPEDEELVKSFGADVVVPRGQGFADAVLEAAPDGVDGAVRHRAAPARGVPGDPRRRADRGRARLGRRRGRGPRDPGAPGDGREVLERTDWLEELRQLASDGRLKLRVAGEFPPEQAAEAQRADGRRRAARPGRDRVLESGSVT